MNSNQIKKKISERISNIKDKGLENAVRDIVYGQSSIETSTKKHMPEIKEEREFLESVKSINDISLSNFILNEIKNRNSFDNIKAAAKVYFPEYLEEDYCLNYLEAIEVLANGGAVKGENFRNSYFLQLSKGNDIFMRGELELVDANNLYSREKFNNILSMKRQKFRSLTVMTKKELSW